MEDVDLAFRASKAGLASLYVHDCVALHIGGGTTRPIKDKRLFYLLRGRVLYARKHYGFWGNALVVSALMLLEPITRLGVAAVGLDWKAATAVLRATNWLWRAYPFCRAIDLGEPPS